MLQLRQTTAKADGSAPSGGAALVVTCPACGSANEPGERFCGECGTALTAPAPPGSAAAISERRVTSILFADLVGFTTLSEQRDPEDVRELLARYFDTASMIVARYGGTLEKFIGDAVVAVWGTPIALEDDAERAVRAALDLVSAVAQLGEDTTSGLQLRAAVSTGETAVTIGALGQGMVAGDVVNTTARMQSAAEPGSVLIDEGTRRSTEAAIDSSPAGSFTLKGKAEPVDLWTALRVVAGRRGEGRSAGARTTLRRPRPRVSAGQGGRAGNGRGGTRAAGLDRGHRRDRQEPAGLGV